MCMESWGMSSFARAMIDLHADVDLKDTLIVVVPNIDGNRYIMNFICVKYE